MSPMPWPQVPPPGPLRHPITSPHLWQPPSDRDRRTHAPWHRAQSSPNWLCLEHRLGGQIGFVWHFASASAQAKKYVFTTIEPPPPVSYTRMYGSGQQGVSAHCIGSDPQGDHTDNTRMKCAGSTRGRAIRVCSGSYFQNRNGDYAPVGTGHAFIDLATSPGEGMIAHLGGQLSRRALFR